MDPGVATSRAPESGRIARRPLRDILPSGAPRNPRGASAPAARRGPGKALLSAAFALLATGAPAETLDIHGDTSPGGAVSLTVTGAPAAPALVLASPSLLCPPISVPGFGEFWLDMSGPAIVLPTAGLDPAGLLALTAPLPADPSLAGLRVHIQAAAPGLSNKTTLLIHGGAAHASGLPGDELGVVLLAADLDMDGDQDVAAAALKAGAGAGAVRLARAPDLLPWMTLAEPSPQPGAAFGAALAAAPLTGAAGFDLVVGAPMAGPASADQTGEVFVFAGPTYASALRIPPPLPEPGAGFGAALAAADLDLDGTVDLAVGAPLATAASTPQAGRVFTFLGPQLAFGPAIDPPAPQPLALFGASLAAADLDLDGDIELIAGAPNTPLGADPEVGRVWLLDAFGGSPPVPLDDPHPSAFAAMGFRVLASDVTGDARPDVLVATPGGEGAPEQNPAAVPRVGEILVFDAGQQASSITLFDPTPVFFEHFGMSVSAGDFDGDGSRDVLVGASLTWQGATPKAGETHVFLGPSFKERIELSAPVPAANAQFGVAVVAADLDADGDVEVLAAEPFTTSGSGGYYAFDG